MTKQEFQTIVAKKIVELKGYEVTPLEDKFSLIVKVEDKLSFQVNLSNFYLRFTKERNTLEEVIQVIINTISLSASKAKETETFEEVKNKLYPIVRDKGHLKQKPLNKNVNLKEVMLFKPLIEDLIIEIAIDYEQNVRFVTIEDLENWGKTKQEIFDLANYNFFRDKDSPLEEITLDNGFKIYYYNVKDGYDATRILLSNRFKEKTIVAIPNRDSLFAMKFEFNIERILFFKSMIYKYWQTQNYAISPELYVYEDGKLREWYKGE